MGQDELDINRTRRQTKPKRWGATTKELNERKTVLHDAFWEDFTLLARVCVLHDPEATIYDVFDTMRTKIYGGWEFSDEFAAKIDAQIEEEERGHKSTL